MSVLACDRNGCENIMCHRLILNSTMYICNSCFEQLESCKETWPLKMKAFEIKKKIIDFMNTESTDFDDLIDVDKEFFRLTNDVYT
jgi:hypothetical protein